ncbi:VOC family protein [Pseudomonas solani]|uniref:VOC family protein n=1 Tax=Pseudomonas solani TaxID=2731552 RepID=UPI003C2F0901
MPLTPLLRCHDLDATRRHYRDALGFTTLDSAHASLTMQLQDCRLIFTEQDLWAAPVACSGTLYLAVADVARYYEQVKDKAEIAWPLQEMDYGSKEFGIRDCNGYTLAFTQVAPATGE